VVVGDYDALARIAEMMPDMPGFAAAAVGRKREPHDRRGVSGRPRGWCPAGRVLALGS